MSLCLCVRESCYQIIPVVDSVRIILQCNGLCLAVINCIAVRPVTPPAVGEIYCTDLVNCALIGNDLNSGNGRLCLFLLDSGRFGSNALNVGIAQRVQGCNLTCAQRTVKHIKIIYKTLENGIPVVDSEVGFKLGAAGLHDVGSKGSIPCVTAFPSHGLTIGGIACLRVICELSVQIELCTGSRGADRAVLALA